MRLKLADSTCAQTLVDTRNGSGVSAVSVGCNRFAALENWKEVIFHGLKIALQKMVLFISLALTGYFRWFGIYSGTI